MPAPWAYFDTSVLVKRYVRERGSSRAGVLLRRYRFLSSAILPVEVMSALCRRRAAGELTRQHFAAILTRIREDRGYWQFVEVSPMVLAQAEELAQQASVTTLDAIHVASAMGFQAASGIRIPFITGDTRQQDVASQAALDVVRVG